MKPWEEEYIISISVPWLRQCSSISAARQYSMYSTAVNAFETTSKIYIPRKTNGNCSDVKVVLRLPPTVTPFSLTVMLQRPPQSVGLPCFYSVPSSLGAWINFIPLVLALNSKLRCGPTVSHSVSYVWWIDQLALALLPSHAIISQSTVAPYIHCRLQLNNIHKPYMWPFCGSFCDRDELHFGFSWCLATFPCLSYLAWERDAHLEAEDSVIKKGKWYFYSKYPTCLPRF